MSRYFLSGILVEAKPARKAVIVFGDSITDGATATPDLNHRWTDYLAGRLASRNVAVVNAGISGSRLLNSRMGASGLQRFERDVLSQPNARAAVILIGTNDIAWPGSAFAPSDEPASPEALVAGYRDLISRARARRIRIVGATLPPFRDALEGSPIFGYYSEQKDAMRQAINHWIRHSGEFDGVLDIDAALRDPGDWSRLRSEVDSGDHLHPSDHGNKAMADAVDLEMLLGPAPSKHN